MPDLRHRRRDLPPGYPSAYESVLKLSDGRHLQVRPILPTDAPELAEAIRSADAATLHARFLGGPPPLTDAVLGGLTKLDYVSRFAVVARSRGRGVAVARYAALPTSADKPSAAEVAIAVRPEWRRVGLATALVELLGRRALECGFTEFTALFLAGNLAVTKLAHEGHARVVIAEGAAELDALLPDPTNAVGASWPANRHMSPELGECGPGCSLPRAAATSGPSPNRESSPTTRGSEPETDESPALTIWTSAG